MLRLPLGEALELQILNLVSFVEDFELLAEPSLEGVEQLKLLTDAEFALGIYDLGDLVHADFTCLRQHERFDIRLRQTVFGLIDNFKVLLLLLRDLVTFVDEEAVLTKALLGLVVALDRVDVDPQAHEAGEALHSQ